MVVLGWGGIGRSRAGVGVILGGAEVVFWMSKTDRAIQPNSTQILRVRNKKKKKQPHFAIVDKKSDQSASVFTETQ